MNKETKFNIITEGLTNGVSDTCKKYNISRTIYYRWLKRYQSKGIDGLIDIKKQFTPKNKTSKEAETILIKLIRTYPKYGPRAIKYLLEEFDYKISESAVYNIMKRHGLTTKESRLHFARKKEKTSVDRLPLLNDFKSGESWIFWITDFGHLEGIGNLYIYTILDLKSKITCSRIYTTISYGNFEELLTAVAIPIAKTLKLNTGFLCFFSDSKIIEQTKHTFKSKINKTIKENELDICIHILKDYKDLKTVYNLKADYTEKVMVFFIDYINKGLSFSTLKLDFQHFIREYNLQSDIDYGNRVCSPIDYHNLTTDSKLILPIWAYIDRDY